MASLRLSMFECPTSVVVFLCAVVSAACAGETTNVTTDGTSAAATTEDGTSSPTESSSSASASTDGEDPSTSTTVVDPDSSTTVADSNDSRDDWDDCHSVVCFSGTECFPAPADDTDGGDCLPCEDDDACANWFQDADSLGCGGGCGGWYCSYDLSRPMRVDDQCCYDLTAWQESGDCSSSG